MMQIRPVSDFKSKFTESIEDALDVADRMAEETTERYTHEEMFAKLREEVRG